MGGSDERHRLVRGMAWHQHPRWRRSCLASLRRSWVGVGLSRPQVTSNSQLTSVACNSLTSIGGMLLVRQRYPHHSVCPHGQQVDGGAVMGGWVGGRGQVARNHVLTSVGFNLLQTVGQKIRVRPDGGRPQPAVGIARPRGGDSPEGGGASRPRRCSIISCSPRPCFLLSRAWGGSSLWYPLMDGIPRRTIPLDPVATLMASSSVA
jgi:hypothetical protein